MAFGVSAFSVVSADSTEITGEMAVSDKEEDISPECARKRFRTGLREGLPECGDASVSSLFMVSAQSL